MVCTGMDDESTEEAEGGLLIPVFPSEPDW